MLKAHGKVCCCNLSVCTIKCMMEMYSVQKKQEIIQPKALYKHN